MADGAPATKRWLFGPLPDLVLGCGLAYVLVFGVLAAGGAGLREWQPGFLAPLVALVLSGPHYGGTLLRVYERRADRRRYAIFAVWATLLVVAAFAVAVHDATFGAWLLTLYITWSPWHYTGQNYGLSVMFLRRRGVDVTPRAKRLLYLSFVCSFLVTFFVLHGSNEAANYVPNPIASANAEISLRQLGIPHTATRVALAVVTAGTLLSLVGAFALLARRSSWRDLGPSAALCMTQALWFSLPFSVQFWNLHTGLEPLDVSAPQYILWIAMGHAVQYLWVTTYYARESGHWSGYGRYLAKALAAGAALWTLPAVLFAPDRLGNLEYAGGLALLVASAVNIHHFILDGAIWKLRDSRVGGVLIRSSVEDEPGASPSQRPWRRRSVWAVCGVSAAGALTMIWLDHFAFGDSLKAGDFERSRAVLDRMAWFGQDSAQARSQLAAAFAASAQLDEAVAQYERSLELRPTAAAWGGLAVLRARRGDWSGVVEAYEANRELGPLGGPVRAAAANAFYALGQREQGRAVLEDALAASPASSAYHVMAGFARDRGDLAWAARYYREALRLDPDQHGSANQLAWILATAADADMRDAAESVRLAERAVRGTDPPDPNHLDTLAAAYAADGRFEEATAVAERAVQLAERRGEPRVAGEARARLDLYRSGKPYLDVPRRAGQLPTPSAVPLDPALDKR